jgi:hypothetical protein
LDVVSIFWLPNVELDVSNMCDHLIPLPTALPSKIQRAAVHLAELSIGRLKDSSLLIKKL